MKSSFHIMKFCANKNGALFIKNGNKIGHPCSVFNGIDEASFLELINLRFNSFTFQRMDMPSLLVDRDGIKPSVDVMSNNGRMKPMNFRIILGEYITELLE